MIKIIIKISNGKTIKSIFEMCKKLIVIKLIVILIINIREFTKLLIKAPFSFFFFANNAIKSEISPYIYKIHIMIIDNGFKNQQSP